MVYGLETHIIVSLSLTLLILLFVTWNDRHERHKNQETLEALQIQISQLENLVKALLQDNQTDALAEIFRQEGVRQVLARDNQSDDPIAFKNAPRDFFANNPHWRALSRWTREEKHWMCENEECRINLESRQSDLHVHHILGKGFNSLQHLKVLCIACHADEKGPRFHEKRSSVQSLLRMEKAKGNTA